MRNLIKPLVAIALTLSLTLPGGAQRLFREDGNFADLMKAADYYEKSKGFGDARYYYVLAARKATNDTERAQAYLGAAKHTKIRYGAPDPKTDGTLKLAEYEKVLLLPAAPAPAKIEAYLGKAETLNAIEKYEDALASLKPLFEMAEVTPEQKRKAILWNGQILVKAKRYDEGRAQLSEFIKLPDAPVLNKYTAHKAIANSYLEQANLAAGLAEIRKINALPELKDEQRADIHIQNGDMILDAGHHQAARDEYEKVAVLADAPVEKNFLARYKIGESYAREKNYASAREVWTQAAAMRGSEKFLANIWRAVGVSHVEEKNYAPAREAYQKWLAVPDLGYQGKIQAWQQIANSYVQEKEYAKAREALSNISKLPPANAGFYDKLQFSLRELLDVAEVYRAEGDFTKAVEVYTAILADVPHRETAVPSFYYEVRDQVWNAAETLAKEPAALAAAYKIYEELEKLYPYQLQDAKAYIAMGDIKLAQGQRAEAKEKYQKALELRKTYDEGKIAQEKLNRLEQGAGLQKPN